MKYLVPYARLRASTRKDRSNDIVGDTGLAKDAARIEKRRLQSELTARSRNVDDGDWKKHADRLSVHFHFASECLTESAA